MVLTDAVFWISAAKAGVSIDKAEKDILVWKQGSVFGLPGRESFLLLLLAQSKFIISRKNLQLSSDVPQASTSERDAQRKNIEIS